MWDVPLFEKSRYQRMIFISMNANEFGEGNNRIVNDLQKSNDTVHVYGGGGKSIEKV
jgi:hypothetical protein